MKFLAIAIICAIVSAASVTAQGQQQGKKKPCEGRTEQECDETECQRIYGDRVRENGSDYYTGTGPFKCMLAEDRVLCLIAETLHLYIGIFARCAEQLGSNEGDRF